MRVSDRTQLKLLRIAGDPRCCRLAARPSPSHPPSSARHKHLRAKRSVARNHIWKARWAASRLARRCGCCLAITHGLQTRKRTRKARMATTRRDKGRALPWKYWGGSSSASSQNGRAYDHMEQGHDTTAQVHELARGVQPCPW